MLKTTPALPMLPISPVAGFQAIRLLLGMSHTPPGSSVHCPSAVCALSKSATKPISNIPHTCSMHGFLSFPAKDKKSHPSGAHPMHACPELPHCVVSFFFALWRRPVPRTPSESGHGGSSPRPSWDTPHGGCTGLCAARMLPLELYALTCQTLPRMARHPSAFLGVKTGVTM